jgi:alpha-mannosidase
MAERSHALAWVEEIPGYGTLSHQIRGGRRAWKELPDPVRGEGLTLANARVRVTVDPHGAVQYEDLATGRRVDGLLAIEDVGDGGDLYTHSALGDPVRETRCVGARLVHRGPLRAEIVTSWRLRIPAVRVRPAATGSRARAADRKTVTLPIEIALSLDAGAGWLRVSVRGRNLARDHRLRVVFATALDSPEVFADAAFAVVKREPVRVNLTEAQIEMPPLTAPLHRYVSLIGAKSGATVFSDGLAEYEAAPTGELAITLVRAVGQLSRNDLPERPGHAGWPAATPDAQSLGAFNASFAFMLHGVRTAETIDLIERTADDVLLPLRGTTLRSALMHPSPTRGIELHGRGLAFSCAKPSEDGRWLVLRCVNLTDASVAGSWRLERTITAAHLARLDETPTGDAAFQGDRVELTAAPFGMVTILAQ